MGMLLHRHNISLGDIKQREAKPSVSVVEEKIDSVQLTEEKQNQYTKTIINRMSTAELKTLAKEQGIENAEDMTGADLKVELIKYFEL